MYRIKAINAHGFSEISSWARAYTPGPGIGASKASDRVSAGPVWSATLTVGEDTSLIPEASGYSTWGMDGTLSTDTFTLDGTTHRVLVLARQSGGLVLGIDQELRGDFTLSVGDARYEARQAARPEAMYRDAYWWEARGVDWPAGDMLEVSLTVADAPQPQLPLAPPTVRGISGWCPRATTESMRSASGSTSARRSQPAARPCGTTPSR